MSRSRHILQQVFPLLLVLGLAGCFKSASPLIDKAHANYPFKTITLKIEDDNGTETEILKRDGDVYRLIEHGETRGKPVLIREITENVYLVQEGEPSEEATYLFAKKTGDKVIVRSDCRGIGAEILKRLNIQTPKEDETVFFECGFEGLNALTTLGQLPEIWSGETKTLQIVSME